MAHRTPGIVNRRTVVLAGAALVFPAVSEQASAASIGQALDVRGRVSAYRGEKGQGLFSGAPLELRDRVQTARQSFARLELAGRTTVYIGGQAQLTIDRYVAETGGTLRLGEGAVLVDRSERLPKIRLQIRSAYGLIGIRGTRVFAGPSRGAFGVFVARGRVVVSAAGESRILTAGQGVEIGRPGEEPGNVTRWSEARIDEALASVGL